MSKKKILSGILISLVIVALQVGAVFAAPSQQTATPPPPTATPTSTTGTVSSITFPTVNGTQVAEITMDVNGTPQTFDVSLTTAASLGLIETDSSGNPVLDSSGNPIVNTTAISTQITLQSTDILNGGTTSTTPANPVASLIENFFMKTFPDVGLTQGQVMTWHTEDGDGFGVIAQACFIAHELNTTCDQVIAFKNGQPNDLSIDGNPPKNWGQLKKAAFTNVVDKSMENLGSIVSGRNKPPTSGEPSVGGSNGTEGSSLSNNPNSPTNDLSKSKGSGHGKGHRHGKSNPNNGSDD